MRQVCALVPISAQTAWETDPKHSRAFSTRNSGNELVWAFTTEVKLKRALTSRSIRGQLPRKPRRKGEPTGRRMNVLLIFLPPFFCHHFMPITSPICVRPTNQEEFAQID